MKSCRYNSKPINKINTLEKQKRELQYRIIDNFQNKVSKMNIEELKVYAKMNDIELN